VLFVGSNLKKIDMTVRAAACGTASGMKLATARQERGVKARVRGGLAMCILAFSGCGVGAPRIFFGGYDSVEPIFCHYADVSCLGT